MSATRFVSLFCGLAALAALAVPTTGRACNVPVFRYALERWEPGTYELVIVHRGALSADQEKAAAWLETLAKSNDAAAVNLTARRVDLDKETLDQPVADIWAKIESPNLPEILVLYPPEMGLKIAAWHGPLTAENAQELVDSPVRRELVKRISQNHTAVWLLFETGDAEKDSAAKALLEKELERLQTTLKLPDANTDDGTGGPRLTEEELAAMKIHFSVLPVPAAAREEFVLRGLLAAASEESQTASAAPTPAVVPVYGRGRALCVLSGGEIKPDNIEAIGDFLVGPCSCQIKESNPGVDMLAVADWNAAMGGVSAFKPVTLPPLTTISVATTGTTPNPAQAAAAKAAPVAAAVATAAAEETPAGMSRMALALLATLGSALVVVVGVSVVVVNRKGRS